jgi:hypothetical protein
MISREIADSGAVSFSDADTVRSTKHIKADVQTKAIVFFMRIPPHNVGKLRADT